MVSKKVLSVIVSCVVALGSFTYKAVPTNPVSLQNGEEIQFDSKGTVDLSIANEEKLIEMLKKSGKLAQNASEQDALKAVKEYLKTMEKDYANNPSQLSKDEKVELGKIKQQVTGKGGSKDNNKFPGTKPRTWDGTVKKDKILVLLEDFKDYKHSKITPDETDMYYKDYTRQHYQDMIFGANGYVGPNGEKLQSMKQYYEQQSGGSYTVDGTVLGWYSAANDAAYYGADSGSSHNIRAKNFVFEALKTAAEDNGVNLADYDQEDPYDIDGDGDINEPDGIIDHLMVIHSGVGQEAGGGILGDDAIWSHSSKLSTGPVAIPGATSNSSNFGGKLAAWAYTIMPEDGAAGVFCHEFGHDLGLPDEYDTIYSGDGEAIEYWSIMSSGSWAGKIPGTEPTGFSPYGKLYFQDTYGGNWMHGTTVNLKDIPKSGYKYVLDQASIKGNNNDYVKVELPDKEHLINKPFEGSYEYFGGKGTDGTPIKTSMSANIDLAGKAAPKLTFKTWYDIEEGWDFASIQVREQGTDTWTALPGNITTTEKDPDAVVLVANGITGSSNGKWVDGIFDLSAYAGKNIELKFEYETDTYTFGTGFYVDNIAVTSADGNVVFSDNAEETPKFVLNGFTKDTGKVTAPNYYILEWRNHTGADTGLAHIKRGNSLMSYDPGLVVWYADNFFSDNWTALHPGEGYLGIVDADQTVNSWTLPDGKKAIATTRYQLHDAAFSQKKTQDMFLDYSNINGNTLTDNITNPHHIFSDRDTYFNPQVPDAGLKLPSNGLIVTVNGESNDRSQATIMLKVK